MKTTKRSQDGLSTHTIGSAHNGATVVATLNWIAGDVVGINVRADGVDWSRISSACYNGIVDQVDALIRSWRVAPPRFFTLPQVVNGVLVLAD